MKTSMRNIDRDLMTKELGKAQTALWAAFQVAARTNNLDLAKALRDQHKAMGDKIVEINGGPVVSVRELLR
jgi:phosphoserine phosphatase